MKLLNFIIEEIRLKVTHKFEWTLDDIRIEKKSFQSLFRPLFVFLFFEVSALLDDMHCPNLVQYQGKLMVQP